LFKRKINILRIKKSEKEKTLDTILIEKFIDVFVNSEPLANIVCLPLDLKELAVGFLFSIGIINTIDEIKEIKINEMENRIDIDLTDTIESTLDNFNLNPVSRVIDTSCGISSPWREIIKKSLGDAKESTKLKDDIKISQDILFSCMKQMQTESPLFRETGGCHAAAIFNLNGNMLSLKEDIGRHNAIDKVIGELLMRKHTFTDLFLTSTGRLTGDSVLKAVRAKLPIVASHSAAIESGVRLAFTYGITLIGFVRGARMNVYTNPHRIIV
jgi:FdhD protein